MAIEIARYQFHSWARRGIAANIEAFDDLAAGTDATVERAKVPVSVKVNDDALTKDFSLIGPGDIIGIKRDMIIRTEPLNWITDFEPNYLAFAEFYDEDFAWRYTPASPQGEKLRPWIFLFVLKEEEFERTKRNSPLPSITVKSKSALPPNNETWLWAHAHSNANIPSSELSDYEKFLLSVNKTANDDPDQFYSRLISPRKLEPNKAYYAFIVPAFETGRLAGLELPTDAVKAQMPSWNDDTENVEFPVYYEWFFRTGDNIDFEYLVKLLVPRPMDEKVGIRDMDCSRPGFVKADSPGELPATSPKIIGLEGALKSPSTVSTVFPNPPDKNEFQVELQKVINLPITIPADLTKDPVVSIPFYGSNHAKKSKDDKIPFDITKNTWLHDLNKDPRTRVPAGFGTLVIQKNQENFMQKAWTQVTKIIEANKKIIAAKFAMYVSKKYMDGVFNKLDTGTLLGMSKPVHKKIMGSPTTIYQQILESRTPTAAFSSAFRRITRPNGKFAKRLQPGLKFDYNAIIHRLNEGTLTASPPKTTPKELNTDKKLAEGVLSFSIPAWLKWLLKNSKIVLIILLLLFVVLAVVTGLIIPFVILAAAAAAAYAAGNNLQKKADASESLTNPKKELELIDKIPPKPDFTLKLENETAVTPPAKNAAGEDSVEASNFRTALKDFQLRLDIKAPEKILKAFDLKNSYSKVKKAITPEVAYPLKLVSMVKFPKYISLEKPENIFPAMAYPDFEDPMYKKLDEISSELLIPNLKLIPENTISLLKTNQKYIESYMVGLNHEMGRELLWREYPTDMRGSYFRQFWDVKGIIKPKEDKTPAEINEEYKDIKPIHTWLSTSLLGKHNNRDAEGDTEQVVLVIRGQLLKHYPNTVIFAQKAIEGATKTAEPVIDLELTETEFEKQLKFPLYKADILPDIKFFGFDLTVKQTKGIDPSPGFTDKLGWFFVIQQVPGEPRYGMDINYNAGSDGITWDDLSWENFGSTPVSFIKSSVRPSLLPTDNSPDKWGVSSANMAYILFQKPSMVAVHAKEMLGSLSA